MAFFQSSFITTLATAGTALLSLSFVFAVTTQEFLGSCIFLFVKHPYDVGDRVEILVDDTKASMLVEKISLLYTIFVRTDKMQLVQTPNIQLNNYWIENVTRSGPTPEILYINVSYDHTSLEDVELLRLEMEKFVTHPDNSRDFQPGVIINVSDITDLKQMVLEFIIMYKANNNDVVARLDRKSKFLCALTSALHKIPIHPVGKGVLGTPGNPNYLVSCTADEAGERRTKMEEDRQKSRVMSGGEDVENADDFAAAAAAAPGGDSAPGGGDWFNMSGGEKPANTMTEGTRVSLDSRRPDSVPKRGESHKGGLRKAGETLSTTMSRQESRSVPRGSTSLRYTTSRRTYDEESQVGSPTAPQHGGFLAPTPSQHGRYPSGGSTQSRPQPGPDPYQAHPAQPYSGQGYGPPAGPPPGPPPAGGPPR